MPSSCQAHLSYKYIDKTHQASSRLIRRASLQLEFARRFAMFQGNTDWAALIDEAEKWLAQADNGWNNLAKAVADVEEKLAVIGQAAKQYRIHCVGHGHIDMNWMWSWPETASTTHDTFASVLSLMREYPTLTYSQSQTSVYALVEKYYPEIFEEIRQRIEEGRWEVTATHWVEGDKNLSSGESICRHLLLTRAYFRDKFGIEAEAQTIDWEPDTFGHASTIPTILAQGGIKHYYCCRPGGGFEHAAIGDPRPRLFYWKAPDGSQVLVNRESTWYVSYVNIGDNIALPLMDFAEETGLHEWLNLYGIGNHGGGPTVQEIEYLIEQAEWPIFPTIEFSTAARYFAAIDTELASGHAKSIPVLDHELNFEFTGCYTSQTLIKQANRFGENYLVEAEALGTIAHCAENVAYPADLMRDAWIHVLFNQFHDILPGSGVRQTREHATALFQEVGTITGALKRRALTALTSRINTASLLPDSWAADLEKSEKHGGAFEAGAGVGASVTGISYAGLVGHRFRPIIVFNPTASKRSERVTASLYDTGFNPADIVALSEDGTITPALCVGNTKTDVVHFRLDVAFDAFDIPSVGYRTYLLAERSSLPSNLKEVDRSLTFGPGKVVTTPFLQYTLDSDRGGVVDVIDRRTGALLSFADASAPLGAFQYVTERPVSWSSWVLGSQVDPGVPLKVRSMEVLGASQNRVTETYLLTPLGGLMCDVNLTVPGTSSSVRVRQSLHSVEPRLDFSAEIDWREIGSSERGVPGLLISVPLPLTSISARYEVPFGSVERNLFDGEEVPSLRYAHVEGQARTAAGAPVFAGVTLLQDCKYGHSIVGNDTDGFTLRLRVVRSSYDPDPTPEIAVTTVRFSLYFHDKPADPAALAQLGTLWNHPPIVVPLAVQKGDAPVCRSFVEVLSPNVALTSFKPSEDGSGVVLRLVELNGVDTDAEVRIDPQLTKDTAEANSVDVFERPTKGTTSLNGDTLRAHVPAFGFVTIRIA